VSISVEISSDALMLTFPVDAKDGMVVHYCEPIPHANEENIAG
jgi:hypothetical protein